MAQIPRADEGLTCPFHKKDMSTVCHKCPLWIQLRGKNPQTNEELDQWGCSLSFMPMLMIEGAQQTRQAGAAIESFRNEMVNANQQTISLMAQQHKLIS
jgi:hypothetical protein